MSCRSSDENVREAVVAAESRHCGNRRLGVAEKTNDCCNTAVGQIVAQFWCNRRVDVDVDDGPTNRVEIVVEGAGSR